jgi:hypothetical protein
VAEITSELRTICDIFGIASQMDRMPNFARTVSADLLIDLDLPVGYRQTLRDLRGSIDRHEELLNGIKRCCQRAIDESDAATTKEPV